MTENNLKEKWIEALESGRYEQTNQALIHENNKFCCLGVLCDLYDPQAWEDPMYSRHPTYFGHPPDNVRKAAGITLTDALNLAILNDQGKSFAEIAQWIRENLNL